MRAVHCVLGHHVGPESRFRGPVPEHFVGNRREVVYETEINRRQGTPLWLRVDSKLWEGEFPCLSPKFDGGLNLRRPEQIGLLRRLWRFRHHGSGTVHVVAADLVLRAVATGVVVSLWTGH